MCPKNTAPVRAFGLLLTRLMLIEKLAELLTDGWCQHVSHVLFSLLHTAVIVLLAIGFSQPVNGIGDISRA